MEEAFDTDGLPPHILPGALTVGRIQRIDFEEGGPNAREGAFLGTAFSYLSKRVFLTAAHCVKDEVPHLIGVAGPFKEGTTGFCFVRNVIIHPTADLALLEMYEGEHCQPQPFARLVKVDFAGTAFWAFGYPEEVFFKEDRRTTPRLFRGHIQRFLDFESHLGYSYRAAEMSIAAPRGLSGGPVFTTEGTQLRLIGLVGENFASYTQRYAEEVESSGTDKTVREYHELINYGVALLLEDHRDWLTESMAESENGT